MSNISYLTALQEFNINVHISENSFKFLQWNYWKPINIACTININIIQHINICYTVLKFLLLVVFFLFYITTNKFTLLFIDWYVLLYYFVHTHNFTHLGALRSRHMLGATVVFVWWVTNVIWRRLARSLLDRVKNWPRN